MVKVLIGHKGTGKTKLMVQTANEMVDTANGSIVFINKDSRLMYDLKHEIRVVCMEEYDQITNVDEYIGFIYGIVSSDHDIEAIFIDAILKNKDVHIPDLKGFLQRLEMISEKYDLQFIVSISADKNELGNTLEACEVLN